MAVMLIAGMFNDCCYSYCDESDVLLVYLMAVVLLLVCIFLFEQQESLYGNVHDICSEDVEKSSFGVTYGQVWREDAHE